MNRGIFGKLTHVGDAKDIAKSLSGVYKNQNLQQAIASGKNIYNRFRNAYIKGRNTYSKANFGKHFNVDQDYYNKNWKKYFDKQSH